MTKFIGFAGRAIFFVALLGIGAAYFEVALPGLTALSMRGWFVVLVAGVAAHVLTRTPRD